MSVPNVHEVKEIRISMPCFGSNPCQHNCKVAFIGAIHAERIPMEKIISLVRAAGKQTEITVLEENGMPSTNPSDLHFWNRLENISTSPDTEDQKILQDFFNKAWKKVEDASNVSFGDTQRLYTV